MYLTAPDSTCCHVPLGRCAGIMPGTATALSGNLIFQPCDHKQLLQQRALRIMRVNCAGNLASMILLKPFCTYYREALLRRAAGPEAFFAMRANFAASLAAVCATNYVAGIGDRHLQNFLLHEATGTLVPIDFG